MVRKAMILAGGLGTRLAEETGIKPDHLVEIGGCPIIWHITDIYSQYGINEYIVLLEYEHYIIKEFFSNDYMHVADVTFGLARNSMEVHNGWAESWKFCLTYGDGVANIDIPRLIEHHISERRLATVTAVRPPGRFGALDGRRHCHRLSRKADGRRGLDRRRLLAADGHRPRPHPAGQALGQRRRSLEALTMTDAPQVVEPICA